jgi:hypothetical protein
MQQRRPDYVGIDTAKLTFRKRPAPQSREETTRERVERELSNLMEDRRYWDGDPDYRAHVRRQFQRVYDSPDNPPQGFRIGPPKLHATTLEPYRPANTNPDEVAASNQPPLNETADPENRRIRHRTLLTKHTPSNERSLTLFGKGTGEQREQVEADKPDAGERNDDHRTLFRRFAAARTRQPAKEGGADKVELFDPTDEELTVMQREAILRYARQVARETLHAFEAVGFDTAHRLLRHYIDGSGKTVTVPVHFVDSYAPVQEAEERVLGHLRNWLAGEVNDTTFGKPTLFLKPGQRIVIGGKPERTPSNLAYRIRWDAEFGGAIESRNPHEIVDEAHWAIGGGHLSGYGSLVLERIGNRIEVSGYIDFRVEDLYDFSRNHLFGYDDHETLGTARSFAVHSEFWRRRVEATIPIVNGSLQPFTLNVLD